MGMHDTQSGQRHYVCVVVNDKIKKCIFFYDPREKKNPSGIFYTKLLLYIANTPIGCTKDYWHMQLAEEIFRDAIQDWAAEENEDMHKDCASSVRNYCAEA